GLAVLESRGRQADGAGAGGDERGEAQAALQPAPQTDSRGRAVALHVPADGHLRRAESPQVDAARRRVDPADRDRLLVFSLGSPPHPALSPPRGGADVWSPPP